MLCEYCNTENIEIAKFCIECGANLQYKSFEKFVSSLVKVNINALGIPFDVALNQQKELLDNLPNFAWIKDLKGNYIYGNVIYAKVNDIKQEDIKGKTDYDFFDSKLADKYQKDDITVAKYGQVLIIEEPFLEGSILETIKIPFLDEKGDVAAIIGVARYISHRGMQNRQLYETNLQLQSYIDKYKASETALKISEMSIALASVPFQWIDENAKIYKVNQAGCDILGYSEKELTSMTIHDIDPNYQKEVWSKNWTLWRENRFTCFETIHIRKDGTTYPVEVTVNFIEFEDQEYIFAYFSDITERKKSEQELLTRNKELQLALDKVLEAESELKLTQKSVDLSLNPIIWVGSNADIYKVNQATCEALGYTHEELESLKVHDIDLVHKEPIWKDFWEKQRKIKTETFESMLIRKDGTTFPVEITSSYISYTDKEYLFANIRDISDRKKFEKALEEERKNLANLVKQRTLELDNSLMEIKEKNIMLQDAVQHKNRFISSMSHELRTPLNAIIGFTQALEKQYFGALNEKQLEYIKLVESSGQHLLSLINDILDASKIDTGAMDFNLEIINVEEIIKEVFSIMESQFKGKKISLSYDIDFDDIKLEVDVRKFKQILLNLLSNALKFTPVKGNVKIEVSKNPESVRFSVIDTGYGIKDKDKPHIFNEFYQSDDVKERALGGAGIGLSLIKRLVEMHKGEIGFESKENEGSKFWFTIPL